MIERKDKIVAKILLADDDLEILELLKFTFEQEHYTVISAQDGLDAFQRVREEKPDIVILDVNMPRFSGFEVCEKIRQDPELCLIPVIMLTSLTKTKDRLTGIKLGADEYLSKPFEPIELVARAEGSRRRERAKSRKNF
jgi:DNA-binding response OmpR family regulator